MLFIRCLICTLFIVSSVSATTFTLTEKQQKKLLVTLYSKDLAQVQDSRILGPLTAKDQVIVQNISGQLLPHSLQIYRAGTISQQRFNRGTERYSALLNSNIGNKIQLVRENRGIQAPTSREVRLLSITKKTALISFNGSIETIPLHSDNWRFIFKEEVPAVSSSSNIVFKSTGKSNRGNIELHYLTAGLRWQMDYVLILNAARDTLEIEGIASLFNHTYSRFDNVHIKLMAGQSSTAQHQQSATLETRTAVAAIEVYAGEQPQTLQPGQTIKIPLIQANNVAIEAYERYHFNITPAIDRHVQQSHPSAYIAFKNRGEDNLNRIFPAGRVKLFNSNAEEELDFETTSYLNLTGKRQAVLLNTGKSADFLIERRQSSYKKTFNGALIAVELKLNNRSNKDKILDLSTDFSHDWQIISSTYRPALKRASSAHWKIKVRANSVTIFNLKTRLKTSI